MDSPNTTKRKMGLVEALLRLAFLLFVMGLLARGGWMMFQFGWDLLTLLFPGAPK